MVMKARLMLLSLLLGLTVFWPSGRAGAAADRLPDLGMARLRNFQIETTSDGKRRLRFTVIIVNVGVGPFEVRGSRPDTSTSEMSVRQRIYNDAGSYRTLATNAKMFFAGDGHNHWHVRDLQRWELRVPNDNTNPPLRVGAKRGFCFYDNYRYGSSKDPVYTSSNSCSGGSSALKTKMGQSIGWGDKYSYKLRDQYIDITGVNPGTYRLWAIADPSNWFKESNENNNFTWVDIRLKSDGTLEIVGYGPTA